MRNFLVIKVPHQKELSSSNEELFPNPDDSSIHYPEEKTYGPFSYEEGLFGAFYTYSVCSPGTCFCKDDLDTPQAWDIFSQLSRNNKISEEIDVHKNT